MEREEEGMVMLRKVERQVLAPGSGVAELAFAFTNEVAAAASRDVFMAASAPDTCSQRPTHISGHREKIRGGFGERSPLTCE